MLASVPSVSAAMRDMCRSERLRAFSLFFFVASFVLVVQAGGYPFQGNCKDLFPTGGAVYRQLCLWTNPAAGVVDIPLLIGLNGESQFAYFESWFNVPASLGPTTGSQYGVLVSPGAYNQSTSCQVSLIDNQLFTPENPAYQPQPDATSSMNVMEDLGLGMYGEGVFCLFTRLYGPPCHAMLQVLQSNLSVGVPMKKIAVDSSVCDPY